MIKQKFILLFIVSFINCTGQTDSVSYYIKQDSLNNIKYKQEKFLFQATIHKYYIYADAWNFINGAGLHLEINLKNRSFYADYLNIFTGYKYDNDWVKNYTNLPSEYLWTNSVSYVLIKKKRNINYELSIGGGLNYGDPIARTALQKKLGGSSLLLDTRVGFALRYSFEKIPIQIRISANSIYFFVWKELIPIIPSFSLGYGFLKLKNDQQKKLQTYSNTPY